MVEIYLDECGFTGEDLFNPDQKIFVIASIKINPTEADNLKKTYFKDVNSRELKHSKLCKYHKQQRMVINFLNYVNDNPDLFIISVTHKRYALICKIVDFIIEPFAYEKGEDLYKDGFNISLANLLYYTLPVFGNKKMFDEIIYGFQEMARLKTVESYKRFFSIFNKTQLNKQLDDLFDLFRATQNYYGEEILSLLPDGALDLAMTNAMQVMATWRSRIKDKITVIHDSSSNMSKQKNIWDAIMDKSMASKTIGYDYRKMTFPIAIEETKFDKSENFVGLQLADVVAGAAARALDYLSLDGVKDIYSGELSEIFKQIKVLPIVPEPKVTPEELGTIGTKAEDPLEFFGEIIHKVKSQNKNAI